MNLDFPKIEEKILNFWKKNKIFEKLRKKNQGKTRWSFLDGPITANNPMGVHHAWGRTYKDLFQRYKALQGFDQRFQNGCDCQGLWVEVEVEKELGFKTKKDIEKYGIAKFVEKCKERVRKYSKIQTEQSIRLGQWMDWKNSYYTLSNENNYTIWHFLKKCWKERLLYKGRDVVPWCPRCGTAISQHEILTEEYKEVWHKAIFVKLPLIGKKNTFFLIWTTTPWTLPGNVALAINPRFQYAKIKDKNGDIFILLKNKAQLIPNGEIIETIKGKNLKKLKYHGPFDELPAVKKTLKKYRHSIIFWKDVSLEEGTGIVHIAPAFGQEDFQLSKKFKLPVINLTDDESRYRKDSGILTKKLVTEVNEIIFENLKKKGLIFKIEDYLHRYPTCWRCKSELIFRLVDEWYISMVKLRKPLMVVAKKIKWIPSFGLERELDWLKNMQDWLISKKRYWGLALPIFECSCGYFEVIGSKEELKERAIEGWEEFKNHSPHRPWVDKVKIKCLKCGKKISRIPDVGNPWLDAGIVPFSTMGYFSDRDFWQKWFPAEFICESFPGQFKNWFYSLIVMSAVLENTNPIKTIFGYALVRDEKGEEMHKSKRNVIWFDQAVKIIGADPMRWMYLRQNPVYNLNFGWKGGEETKRKLLTLWNSFLFFKTYVDKKEFPSKLVFPKTKNLLDLWIISRLNNLIEKVTRNLDRYNVATVSSNIEKFFTDDLSLWYIRRSRRRFHPALEQSSVRGKKTKRLTEEGTKRREAVETLYYVLLNLMKLISPMMPFLAEEIYQNLKTPKQSLRDATGQVKKMPQSIHLFDWPKSDKKLINQDLEEKMKKIREIVALALAERTKFKIKVRQPLLKLKIKNLKLKINKELLDLIKEEINVKKIVFDKKIKKEIELDTKITQALKEEGMVRELVRNIQEMRKKSGLTPKDKIIIGFSGSEKYKNLIKKWKNYIKKETLSRDIKFEIKEKIRFSLEKEITFDEEKVLIAIKKI
jgi:isoleucyl-tRNA synthetase